MKSILTLFFAVIFIKGFAQETLQTVTERGTSTNNEIQFRSVQNPNKYAFMGGYPGYARIGAYDATNSFDNLIFETANIGIGTTNPTDKLQVEGNQISLRNATTNNGIIFNVNAFGHPAIIPTNGNGTQDKNLLLAPFGGNVGIGAGTPTEKLSVNGKIRAKEIKVEATNWPDYVFAEGYKVGKLEELESYIKANKHLPGMPSAKEIEKNGIAVSEMLKMQQKKIEELTLHLIEKSKKSDLQDKLLMMQAKKLEILEKKIKNIEKSIIK